MDLVPFQYFDHEVRIVVDDDGNPWWVADDVCTVLGLANTSSVISRLESDEYNSLRLTEGIQGRGNPSRQCVNEAGLFSLILSSRKPEAKAFKRWITHEVLPALRRDGSYQLRQGEPKTALQLIREQMHQSLAMLDELQAIEERTVLLEAEQHALEERMEKVEASNAPPDFYTALGFCRLQRIEHPSAPRAIGVRCTKLCQDSNLPFYRIPDSRYGTVNSYPLDTLRYVAKQLGFFAE